MEIPLTKAGQLWALEGYGTFRARGGFFLRAQATLTAADGRVWTARQASRWSSRIVIADVTGNEAGHYEKDKAFTIGGAHYDLSRNGLARDGAPLASFATKWISGMYTTTLVTVLGDIDALVLLTATWFYRQRTIDSNRARV